MRVGFNPNKDKPLEPNDFFHQVIVPVYIPNQEGYFKDSFQILKYCLGSLIKTSHCKTYFTIVNNGSCQEVITYLNQLKKDNKIQEIIHTTAIGKLNAILKGLTGHKFDLITISDADVMFLNNWQEETYKVFEEFPKTGAVCPTPSSRSLKNHTFNIWFDLLFSKSLRFSKVKNPEALKVFAVSIGNPYFYNLVHLEKYLTVSNRNFKAVVGAGHFVATYRKEVFENNNLKYSSCMLGGNSENKFLDVSVIQKGMWRLSTADNFAYHLGNVQEKWMEEVLDGLRSNDFFYDKPIILKKVRSSKFELFIKNKIFSKIITRKKIWQYCMKFKGLSSEEIGKYK